MRRIHLKRIKKNYLNLNENLKNLMNLRMSKNMTKRSNCCNQMMKYLKMILMMMKKKSWNYLMILKMYRKMMRMI